ncbi:MAG: DNA mismatch repair endonuclease MutL [Kangiellaceae bacterium]|nr:DNA mismatch repair endonuclease MutL [Kangiellaceae bacterium]
MRIQSLPTQLINQIAAGEVVERPSSIVKELIENCFDAGATQIQIELEQGGIRLIKTRDNGCGIIKEDLPLALSRHATSKISTSQDLAAIKSLGFRGEALASISSVSKLCLTSRTQNSEFAWQAIAEGRDMEVEVLPAAATVGTRIEVRDLFYNTPARQKFLKAEKTEFNHIEEIFKRHALANPSIAFILKHNDKVVKRVPASHHQTEYKKRIESICGGAFASSANEFSCGHDELEIHGWLCGINYHRSESDIQYVFLNGRPVKDKMLNHAIRQAYQGLLPPGRMPTYIIFLSIDLDKVDVNVHPTKHEVRFDEQRMVHDLLVKSISEVLVGYLPDSSIELNTAKFTTEGDELSDLPSSYSYPKTSNNRNANFSVGYSKVSYAESFSDRQISNHSVLSDENTQIDKNLTNSYNKIRLDEKFWVALDQHDAYLINEQKLFSNTLSILLNNDSSQKEYRAITSKSLLFPQTIEMNLEHLEELENIERLEKLGFSFEPKGDSGITLQKIPTWLEDCEVSFIVSNFEHWVQLLASRNKSDIARFYQLLKPFSSDTIDELVGYRVLSDLESSASKISIDDLQNKIVKDN